MSLNFHPEQIGAHQGITGSYVLYGVAHTYYLQMVDKHWLVYTDYDPCYWRYDHEKQDNFWIFRSDYPAHQLALVMKAIRNTAEIDGNMYRLEFSQLFIANLREYKLSQLRL